jgi:hypothetical protein
VTVLKDRTIPIERIVLHCSDSPQGRGDDITDVHRWHLLRGWHGCGYHHVILEDGTVQDGRPHWWMGSHVYGHNAGSLGILLMGETTFPEAQLQAAAELVKRLLQRYPMATVCGHRDLDPAKTCPNFDVDDFLSERVWADDSGTIRGNEA